MTSFFRGHDKFWNIHLNLQILACDKWYIKKECCKVLDIFRKYSSVYAMSHKTIFKV